MMSYVFSASEIYKHILHIKDNYQGKENQFFNYISELIENNIPLSKREGCDYQAIVDFLASLKKRDGGGKVILF